ncbi:helix-turn-helix domain-containing protein [Actinoallomurus purpureus]|uniref:helix-turn-helix domain-containing protein n=1 Tax=Actinoallomurus purpureus TaxID=478114 RepID=UPI0020938452|nr:helix-turn-helix transcriptional regulator [Actinoallomurus purpureus]MCO6005470.1 helix-turn-helix domain-containing protein [Actinoallomurus purpureus]
MDARAEIGRRVARARRRRGLSQTVLAELVGRSESWLSQVERGLRTIDSHSVLIRLAEVLSVEISQLTAHETDTEIVKYEPVAGIRDVMARYGALPGVINASAYVGRAPNVHGLDREMRRANRLYQAARYDEVGRLLPGLIDAVEQARLTCALAERRTVETLRALTYHSVTMTLSRVGDAELAWMAADRSIAAAEAAERPLLGAVSAYRLGYVLIRLKQVGNAEDLLMRAADALSSTRRSKPPALSVRGGLYLAAATAAATRFDRAGADRHLAMARKVAGKVGADRNDFWSAFGPTNVVIHEVSTAVAFGDAKLALERGESLDLDRLGPGLRGRRAQVFLDMARAYAQQRKDAAAVNTLLRAERVSPELVRYDQRTNDLLTELVRREHRASTPELRGLAHRAGAI